MGRLQHDVGGGAVDLGGGAAHHAGDADRAGVVDDQQIVGVQRPGDVVQGDDLLPRYRLSHPDRAGELAGVVGVQRLPGLQHHVVGDIDGQRDGAHPGHGEPARHPARGGPGGVDAGDGERDEERAGRIVQDDRVAVGLGRRGGPVDHVGEGQAQALGGFAGQPADRQAVADVGRDVDVEDVVTQQQHAGGVVARRQPGVRGQHDDAVMVMPDAELQLGADHAVGEVPVGLAGADREPAGQHGTRQRDHHQVTDRKVVRPTDHRPAALGVVIVRLIVFRAYVYLHPADGLAVLLRLVDGRQHAADHDRPGDVGPGLVDRLDLQPGADQHLGQFPSGQTVRQRGPFPQPAQWRPHRATPFSDRLNRTSPCTMSRMSAALLRNMSVRSMPMPKAKPE